MRAGLSILGWPGSAYQAHPASERVWNEGLITKVLITYNLLLGPTQWILTTDPMDRDRSRFRFALIMCSSGWSWVTVALASNKQLDISLLQITPLACTCAIFHRRNSARSQGLCLSRSKSRP